MQAESLSDPVALLILLSSFFPKLYWSCLCLWGGTWGDDRMTEDSEKEEDKWNIIFIQFVVL